MAMDQGRSASVSRDRGLTFRNKYRESNDMSSCSWPDNRYLGAIHKDPMKALDALFEMSKKAKKAKQVIGDQRSLRNGRSWVQHLQKLSRELKVRRFLPYLLSCEFLLLIEEVSQLTLLRL